ncbi:multidrug efflux pump subunit AcrA (membrane-fusion protein) [Leucobacter exalbidus]|uniref:Multidrug efflux pump subunit AcrA (Membrane-fusion protein) n=1 Tax=Leucobacter exalbidus TaxID=662960 RepID=A0A940T4L7_9MICO|nr:hypothetical protein [Leucobacter exalbidus]MBP1326954.1 multidrug efflux pump subunit AcrA (membrane-fusion protein) [Leucobacter exalbidus]
MTTVGCGASSQSEKPVAVEAPAEKSSSDVQRKAEVDELTRMQAAEIERAEAAAQQEAEDAAKTATAKAEKEAAAAQKAADARAAEAAAATAGLGSCEELLPIDQARAELEVDTVQFSEQSNDAARVITHGAYGPAATAAFSAATDARSCVWVIPQSDGFLYFTVATIPDEAREQFLAALRASDYVESAEHGVPSFELMVDGVGWGGGEGPVRFAFVGPHVYTSAAFTGQTLMGRVIPALR